MKILRGVDLIDVPWKNGGGITRNIAVARFGDQIAWRLSRADVAQDGAFSDFAGLERILTVVAGAGMVLESPGGTLDAEPWQPVRFDGGLEVFSHLKDGPLSDLNLMFDPALCAGAVTVREGPLTRTMAPFSSGVSVLHVLAGQPRFDARVLDVADTAFLDGPADLTLPGDAAVLEITIRYLDPGNAIGLSIADRPDARRATL